MTQTNIPYARRNYIKSVVADACVHFNTPKLPLEIKAFARSYSNIRLISYSKHIRKIGVTYDNLVSIAKDSFTDYYANANTYYIYYNDIDYHIVNSNRYRWNIAHELGHVLLRHLSENDKTRILRLSLSDTEYDKLEEEADYFAQLILVPHAALLGFRIDGAKNIKAMCKISEPASKKRYYEFIDWKSHLDAEDEYDKRIFKYYYSFIFKRKCKKCGVGIIQRYGKHCPICGEKNILEWGDGDTMKYSLLNTHDNGKLKECPLCHNEETEIEGGYCQICGQYLLNECANSSCDNYGKILPSNVRYCPVCGSNSIFYNANILFDWNYEEKFKEELPFRDGYISIPDGFDEELPFN